MTEATNKLDPAILAGFTGSEEWYRHGLCRSVLYTQGVQYVAETAGAYWLLDEIALAQRLGPRLGKHSFQVWRLKLNKTGHGAELRCEDGNYNKLFSKRITFTDFPQDIELWVEENVILLPSEH